MAVFTKLKEIEIRKFINIYNIGNLEKYDEIIDGIENTNYLIVCNGKKYILTIFEKRVSKKEIPFFMKLMDILNSSKIDCPKPLKTNSNSYIIKLKNKSACIVSFLEGKDKKLLSTNDCFAVGKSIARMHLITKKIKLNRKNSMGISKLNALLNSIKFKSEQSSKLKVFLKNNLKNIKRKWPKNLPKGIIHGDLFVDNIFFKKNKLSGIIDFYFAANDFFMYEIAICINALCFDNKNKKFLMNQQKIKSLIKGYQSVRKISLQEKNSLNVLCRGAAIRYLLTRLYDFSNTPKTALIKIKDPNEYYQKLLIHNNLRSFRDYQNK